MVAFNKLFQRFEPPGVSGADNAPGESSKWGNFLPPGVNPVGVIPGSLVELTGMFNDEMFGILRLCLFAPFDSGESLLSGANDLSNGFNSKSKDVVFGYIVSIHG